MSTKARTEPQDSQGELGNLPARAEVVRRGSLGKTAKHAPYEPAGIQPPSSQEEAPKETEGKLKFVEHTHNYIREYIRTADHKAAFFFAGATALIAYLHKANLVATWIKPPKTWQLVDMLSLVGTLGLAICAIACLFAILPRLDGSRRGLIYFEAIKEFTSSTDYAAAVTSNTSAELLLELTKHCHELARICSRKYTALLCAQWLGAVGSIAAVLLLILST